MAGIFLSGDSGESSTKRLRRRIENSNFGGFDLPRRSVAIGFVYGIINVLSFLREFFEEIYGKRKKHFCCE